MIKNSIVMVALASLIASAVGARSYESVNLSESNQQQFIPLLAPFAIGTAAALLSKGMEPREAGRQVVSALKQDLESAAAAGGNALATDLNLEDTAQYMILDKTIAGVKSLVEQALPRLKDLIQGKKMSAEQAADTVSKEMNDKIAEETVKETAAAVVDK